MRFRVSKVQRLVEDSVCRSRHLKNPLHGITGDTVLENLVTPPVSKRFYIHPSGDEPRRFLWLWEVWDEMPGTNDGLLIVFDPRLGMYGTASKPGPGQKYGSFSGFDGYEFGDAIVSL